MITRRRILLDNGGGGGYENKYFTFTATQSGTFKFSGNSINYSLDSGSTWTSLASNTNTPTVNAGDKIMWKATLTPTSSIGIGTFVSSGNFTVEGNAMSLLYGDNYSNQTSLSGKYYAFNRLFSDCTKMTSAEKMSLPATTLATYCYHSMFYGCTSLNYIKAMFTTTPSSSYMGNWVSSVASSGNQAFSNCSGLTSIDIPSGITSIGIWTFDNCRSLTSVTVNATTPPTLGSYAFDGTNNCPIYVPSGSVSNYKSATNWSSYSSRIQAIT